MAKLLSEEILVLHGNYIETFTSYDVTTRIFTLAASGYPTVSSATFWEYAVSDDISYLTPLSEAATIDYPMSSSPAPLDVAPLKMVSLLNAGTDATHLVVFSNGEMHQLDLASKTFKQLARIADDARLLSTEFPRATWSHAYDAETHSVMSVVVGASNAYTVKTDLTTGTVGEYLPMIFAVESPSDGFSSQTFIGGHMAKYADDVSSRFTVVQMSQPNVGFDQINFVDTTTGQLEDKPIANMMEDAMYFECTGLMCDSQRTSVYDAANKRFIFQAHEEKEDSYGTALYSYYYDVAKVTGLGWWYATELIPSDKYPNWGMSGFQLVDIIVQ